MILTLIKPAKRNGNNDGNNLLTNDSNNESLGLKVLAVNGTAIGTGASIALDKGVVFVNEDGSIDFNANGDFDDLKLGETATVSFEYTIEATDGAQSTATAELTVNGEGFDTCLEVHENATFVEDFDTKKCVYTEDVWFAGAPLKDVYSSNNANSIVFGYDVDGFGNGTSPNHAGAKDGVVILYIKMVPSDFENLDVVDITNIQLNGATDYLIANGGHSVFKSQYWESWTGDYYAGTQERLSILDVRVDGFTRLAQ